MPPCAWHSAVRILGSCRSPASPRIWVIASVEAEHRSGVARMTIGQHAAVGIHGFAASGPADAAGQPGAALTLAAKAEILDLHEQRRGEAVIELQKINIVGREPASA
ncbi:MAG: hypothetical protein CM15mP103_07150 [Gammaproteobacteria bacterium]|nr:MAG: hypothetical protein CM15mP103_07150 [Gammaproteobacteria bacterium]